MQPVLRIGKSGLTNEVMNEIKLQLKKKKMIKIKLLKAALGRKSKWEYFSEIIAGTNARLVSKVGFVMTIHKI